MWCEVKRAWPSAWCFSSELLSVRPSDRLHEIVNPQVLLVEGNILVWTEADLEDSALCRCQFSSILIPEHSYVLTQLPTLKILELWGVLF